jgi:hypothetical protein
MWDSTLTQILEPMEQAGSGFYPAFALILLHGQPGGVELDLPASNVEIALGRGTAALGVLIRH